MNRFDVRNVAYTKNYKKKSQNILRNRKNHLINNPKMFNGATDDLAAKP